ncbi:sulfur carrier protein ThiS [uncultured Limnobacter sp.]|uniref:sulfur carrier protein ThiS n=1 Tax=uncultured Limnobacter sp. TaxID=199681 RepID=UPI0030F95F38
MQVTVNGENRELPNNSTVAHLVESLQLTGKRIAVELNGEIVPKSQHATTTLSQGASLEIVVAVGGG